MNKSNLDIIIREVKQGIRKQEQGIRELLIRRKELITRLGNAFEAVISNLKDVCEEIKNSLHEEITDKIISARDIERYCPDKWKKRTKPKNDKLSFSRTSEQKPQQQIATMQGGKSVIINETSSNTQPSAYINQLHDQSKQNGTNNDGNNNGESRIPITNVGNTVSCSESLKPATVEKLSLYPSDKQECSQCVEFTIPKEKYAMVQDAMDKSKASIFVKFDGNKKFLGADPDVFDNSEQKMKIQNPVKRPRTSNLRSKE